MYLEERRLESELLQYDARVRDLAWERENNESSFYRYNAKYSENGTRTAVHETAFNSWVRVFEYSGDSS